MDRIETAPMMLRKAIPSVNVVLEASGNFPPRKSVEAIGAVNTICTPKDQRNSSSTRIFETVNGPSPLLAMSNRGFA